VEKIIEVKGLKKNYGPVEAVKGIDFYVEKGKLFAFLGPNGAGKTTTINVICTLLTMNAGEVIVNEKLVGKDDDAIREDIGIVFQEGVLDQLLTVKENLVVRGSFYHMEKEVLDKAADDAMKVVDIVDLQNRRYGTLSGGQKRRADIARALIHHPKILFLDEPTTGLDPQTRKNVWNTIQELQRSTGMTIFLTTHYMEEAEEADFVIVIDNGLIAAKGTPTDLKDEYSYDTLRIKPMDENEIEIILKDHKIDYVKKNELIIVSLADTLSAIPILSLLEGKIESFQVLNGTMDDAFIGITGKEIRG
jgi:multidrug/hemolysin transport system ATP-binding protein